jgi:SNF2 family DNA or RNA helicase
VIGAWQYWSQEQKTPMLGIVNPERLRLEKTPWYQKGQWRFPANGLLIWDEVHHGVAGPKTLTTTILASTKAYRIPLLAMSATLADSPVKLRALGYLLGLHGFRLPEFYDWCLKHGCYFQDAQLRFTKGPAGTKHMARIFTQIQNVLVRLRIEDIPDFPEQDLQVKLYNLEEKYRDEIAKIYEALRQELKAGAGVSSAELAILRARQRTELYKVPLLLDLVHECLEEEHSAVVFVGFRDTVQALHEGLQAKRVSAVRLLGGQDGDVRQAEIDAFNRNEKHVCLATLGAGGVGINLHDSLRVRPRRSFITPSWSATELVQCLGRTRRAGGTKAVQQFVLIADTVEERIYGALTQKLRNIQALQDGDLTPFGGNGEHL